MNIVHIVGRRNHGKTQLITELVREFNERELAIATAKHCGHPHELDTPGKDSFHHRTAGAVMAAVITPSMCAVFKPRASVGDVYADLVQWAGNAAFLLVEGDIDGPGNKFEVWRAAMGGSPLAFERDDICAIITDDFTCAKTRSPNNSSVAHINEDCLASPAVPYGELADEWDPHQSSVFKHKSICSPVNGTNIPVWPREDIGMIADRMLGVVRDIAHRDKADSTC